MKMTIPASEEYFELVERLSKDLAAAAKLLGRREARYLVDLHYQMQDFRIQAGQQCKAHKDVGEPHRLITWVFESARVIEENIVKALDIFTREYRVGRWMQSILGIGPIMSAGLLAHLEMEPWKCAVTTVPKDRCTPENPHPGGQCRRHRMTTVGHFWSYAGLNPTRKWEAGKVRPWNARLKTLCAFKIGESFVKVQNRPKDFYGRLFASRKNLEWQMNLEGRLQHECQRMLREYPISKSTNAYQWYTGKVDPKWAQEIVQSDKTFPATIPESALLSNGKAFPMLPPAHIHARARRWVVKLFLSHLHHVMHVDWFGTEPPMPYVFEHPNGVDHRELIPPPNWPMKDFEKAKSLRALQY